MQAEDELAAIGMVIGASWNGARAFTSTAGPGISLMNELLGLAYYAEIPAVVIDVQRVGPSTGMPTRTQQADILECAYASHGDTQTHSAVSRESGRVFRFRREGVRSGRAVPDAGLHAFRSRYRHERLGDAAAELGRSLPSRSRPRADRGRSGEDHEVPALLAVRTRTCRGPYAARRGSARAPTSPAARATTSLAAIPKFRTNTSEVMDRLALKHKAAAALRARGRDCTPAGGARSG